MSGRRKGSGNTWLTRVSLPTFCMVSTSASKTSSWRRPLAGRLTWQLLVTWDVVSMSALPLRSGDVIPSAPRRGRMPRRLRWMSRHSSNDRLGRQEVSLEMSLEESSSRSWATLPWCGSLTRETVQQARMTERRPRTAFYRREGDFVSNHSG